MEKIAEALKIAVEMEKKGYDLYKNAAQKTFNRLGRKTLEVIAAKELDHITAINEFMMKACGGDASMAKAIEDIKVTEKKEYVVSIMEIIKGELDSNIKRDSDLEKAYEVAKGLEKESYALYSKLAGEAEEPQVKQFFEFLMKEEQTHYDLLQETLEYLNNPADWFKTQERWIVEG